MRTLTHSHDADGLRTGLVYPGGNVLAAGYTARGQLATMTFHGQPVATSTYRPNGQPIGTVYGNGAQRTLSYDAAGRLTGTGTNVGAATITGRGYALDAVGRRTGYVDETAANAVFSYDPAGQVLGGTVPVPGQPASVNTYAYDPEGNRTQSSTGIQPAPADPVTITGSTTYTANPLNQYTAITGNPNPTYDADGNLLSGLRSPLSGFTSTWNGENRMLSSTSANVAITDRRVENAYDALGRRVRKTVKFASTGAVIEDRYFIYDGWNVIEETIAPATGPVETAEAVWGADLSGTAQGAGGVGGLLLRESSANGASYYHYDGNGNVTALTSGTGTVQAAYTYGPFGETLRAVGPLAQANPWRFSTKYQDEETGLLYYGYRFYNPTDGRWLSRDPIGEGGGINLYGMVGNEPMNAVDLLGLRVTPSVVPPPTLPQTQPRYPNDIPDLSAGFGANGLNPSFHHWLGDRLAEFLGMSSSSKPTSPSPNQPEYEEYDEIDSKGVIRRKRRIRQRHCLPCDPKVGTEAYRHDKCGTEGDSRMHKPCPGSHVHWYVVSQRPPHAFVEPCKCEFVLNKWKAGTHGGVECVHAGWTGPQGISSNGDKTPVGGGGFAP